MCHDSTASARPAVLGFPDSGRKALKLAPHRFFRIAGGFGARSSSATLMSQIPLGLSMVSPKRSKIMRSIRSKHTRPELFIRSLVHKGGFRFRLHSSRLPGHPDLVLSKHRAVVLVSGCFWHGHDCHIYNPAKRRSPEWERKIARNRERDLKNLILYRAMGWKTMTIWECAIQGKTSLSEFQIMERIQQWILFEKEDIQIIGDFDRTGA